MGRKTIAKKEQMQETKREKNLSLYALVLEVIIGILVLAKLFVLTVDQTDLDAALTEASKNIIVSMDLLYAIENQDGDRKAQLSNLAKFIGRAAKDIHPFLGERVHGCGYFPDGKPNKSPDAKDGLVVISKSPAGALIGFTDLVETRYPDGTPCVGMIDDKGDLFRLKTGIARSNWIEVLVGGLGLLLIYLKILEYRRAK